MANRCSVCKKVMPLESHACLQHPSFTIYVHEKDKKGNVILQEHQTETVCGEDCLVESMESASRKIPKGEEYRIWATRDPASLRVIWGATVEHE